MSITARRARKNLITDKNINFKPHFLPCVSFDGSWQLDVMNVGFQDIIVPLKGIASIDISEFNDDINALLVMIDVTSRFLIIEPLNKGNHAHRVRQIGYRFGRFILKKYRPYIASITTDLGIHSSEYRLIKSKCKKECIDYTAIPSTHHTTLTRVNRIMRTIREWMDDHFNRLEARNSDNEIKFRWIDKLDTWVNEYNNRKHSNLVVVYNSSSVVNYTPTQVLKDPAVSSLIRNQEYKLKKHNYKYRNEIENAMKNDEEFYYRVSSDYNGKTADTGYWLEPMKLRSRYLNRFIPYKIKDGTYEDPIKNTSREMLDKLKKYSHNDLIPKSKFFDLLN